jgi:hypothetical protein
VVGTRGPYQIKQGRVTCCRILVLIFTQRHNAALQQSRDHHAFHHDENGLPSLLSQLRSMAAVAAEENIGAYVGWGA